MKTFVRPGQTWDDVAAEFAWDMPRYFNLGSACSDVHPRDAGALSHRPTLGKTVSLTFGDVSDLSNRMANTFRGLGLSDGDRIAVNLGQDPATAIANIGAFKANLVSVPLSSLFGPDALRFRMADSAAKVLITDATGLEKLERLLEDLPDLDVILVVGDRLSSHDKLGRVKLRPFWKTVGEASSRFIVRATEPDEPCMVLYTSGTTGAPKGVVHAHRVAWGQAPGRQLTFGGFPMPGDCIWTPADWAWTGGLVSCLLAGWLHGVRAVSAHRSGPFEPEWALDLMEEEGVTTGYIPPTALRMMMACPRRSRIRLRSASCGGEKWNRETLREAREAMGGAELCEGFGQTEADTLSGCFPSGWETRAGTAGRIYPFHDLRIVRGDGSFADTGEVGEAILRLPDPAAMLRYLNNPEATEQKMRDGWLHTGDLAQLDEDGYLHFVMRADEVIKSSGYRIGPGEVEECLHRHQAIRTAVVVGAPDRVRGQIVKAYVLLRDGVETAGDLTQDIQDFVKTNLGAYQYPRQIEFLESFPLTTNGKIDRGALRRHAAGTSESVSRGTRRSTV